MATTTRMSNVVVKNGASTRSRTCRDYTKTIKRALELLLLELYRIDARCKAMDRKELISSSRRTTSAEKNPQQSGEVSAMTVTEETSCSWIAGELAFGQTQDLHLGAVAERIRKRSRETQTHQNFPYLRAHLERLKLARAKEATGPPSYQSKARKSPALPEAEQARADFSTRVTETLLLARKLNCTDANNASAA
ncbi:hypothetical protein IGI04_034988 [Brassica rapa subsp. trilocularis]|uniref:Uncharacterized protein n=1 Tax=Brassica rapa subsp. trilocularis TaxID=1813537 RepID=A0ABQ7LDF3_BRACM|nr:hypothetical protein IGI04_034988 [Brassica rapa subsp. trilocularis]